MKEHETMLELGIDTEILAEMPGYKAERQINCIKFPQQGQFHIMKYIKGLADAIIKGGGEIYTESKAIDITEKGASSILL